jgi:hypothetical protein
MCVTYHIYNLRRYTSAAGVGLPAAAAAATVARDNDADGSG